MADGFKGAVELKRLGYGTGSLRHASTPTCNLTDDVLPSVFAAALFALSLSVYQCDAQRWPQCTACEPALLPLVHAWYASIDCAILLLLPPCCHSALKPTHIVPLLHARPPRRVAHSRSPFFLSHTRGSRCTASLVLRSTTTRDYASPFVTPIHNQCAMMQIQPAGCARLFDPRTSPKDISVACPSSLTPSSRITTRRLSCSLALPDVVLQRIFSHGGLVKPGQDPKRI
ncbi:hypothetical protein B0H19DRAFT_1377316 [Mycena capillaripes]|nr:hypothetical protein B0H19DRAFT_1377316 [Mycena capillaripes]